MDEDLKQYLIAMESRMNERMDGRMDSMESRLNENVNHTVEKMETKLLTAFHQWARTMEIRVRHGSTTTSSHEERLALIEERVSELERR